MDHRHLRSGVGFTSAAIDDILERGGVEDWIELRRAVDADPHGEIAERVLKMCDAGHKYGTSPLWTAYIRYAREGVRFTAATLCLDPPEQSIF